ncbi:hypothetical protein NT6N_36860 [Oceaniferula spumae]|uniref:Sigma-70 family RNA polymerase sigma factor n=1 Tax=Oceaniferula spumae TaxID=2979115 RepID=A0AAT9FRM6_9BACT
MPVTNTPDDQQLLREWISHRSEKSFKELMQRHMGLVVGLARRKLDSAVAQEDVVQEVFTKLALEAHKIRNPMALPGWLYQCTSSACKEQYRSSHRHRRKMAKYNSDLPDSPDEASQPALLENLDEVLECLPAKERQIVLLRHVYGYSLKELAAKMGDTQASLQKRGERALHKIRKHFEDKQLNPIELRNNVAFASLLAPQSTWPSISTIYQGIPTGKISLLTVSYLMKTKIILGSAFCLGAVIPLGWQQVQKQKAEHAASTEENDSRVSAHTSGERGSKRASDMEQVLSELLQDFPPKRGKVQKELQLCQLISTLSIEECRMFEEMVREHHDIQQLTVLVQFLLQRWAELNPEEAYDKAHDFASMSQFFLNHEIMQPNELSTVAGRMWAYLQPESVMKSDMAKSFFRGGSAARLRSQALQNIITKYGHAKALDYAADQNGMEDITGSDAEIIIRDWASKDIGQALAQMEEKHLKQNWDSLFFGAYKGEHGVAAYKVLFEYGDPEAYFDAGAHWEGFVGAQMIKKPSDAAEALNTYWATTTEEKDHERVLSMLEKVGDKAREKIIPLIKDPDLKASIEQLKKQ